MRLFQSVPVVDMYIKPHVLNHVAPFGAEYLCSFALHNFRPGFPSLSQYNILPFAGDHGMVRAASHIMTSG